MKDINMSDTNKTTSQQSKFQLVGEGHAYEANRDKAVRCLILDHLLHHKPGADLKAVELISRLKPRGQLKSIK